jgi:hypothetical protein
VCKETTLGAGEGGLQIGANNSACDLIDYAKADFWPNTSPKTSEFF